MITKDQILEALKNVKDPEVGYDIVTMGLIYDIQIKEPASAKATAGKQGKKGKEQSEVKIVMTYTTPFCPWGPQLNDEVITALKDSLGVKKVEVEITFDPPYKMPDELRATLGI